MTVAGDLLTCDDQPVSAQPQPYLVPVTIHATQGISVRFRTLTMWVEFAPGRRLAVHPGTNVYQVPPGRYHVRVWCQYVWMAVGAVQQPIDTTAEQPVTISYAAPRTIYGPGAVSITGMPERAPFFERRFVFVFLAIFVLCMGIATVVALTQ